MTDVLIVGGGPAGLSLAILARQMGFSAELYEATGYPRIRHGDTFPDGIGRYFEMLGISSERLHRQALPFHSHLLKWGGSEQISAVEHCQRGFTMTRAHLEGLLLERAGELGVEIHRGCIATRVQVRAGRVCGLETRRGLRKGRFVVDAGGSQHWLARKLGLGMDFYSPPLYGCYNWARGRCPECDQRPLIYAVPDGWIWISKVEEPDLYQFTRLSFAPLGDITEWLPREFVHSRLRPIGPARGADMTWRIVTKPAGPGYFLVGDAVRRNDPMSNRGFELALMDAFKVALRINAWRRGELDELELARGYVDETVAYYRQGLKESYRFLATHPWAPDWLKGPGFYRA